MNACNFVTAETIYSATDDKVILSSIANNDASISMPDRFRFRDYESQFVERMEQELKAQIRELNSSNERLQEEIEGRKRAEEVLRLAAATFESHEAVVITDAQASIIRVNRAFSDITGYPPEEVIGKNPRIMNSGKHDPEFYADMWKHLHDDGKWSGEIWDKRKNGKTAKSTRNGHPSLP